METLSIEPAISTISYIYTPTRVLKDESCTKFRIFSIQDLVRMVYALYKNCPIPVGVLGPIRLHTVKINCRIWPGSGQAILMKTVFRIWPGNDQWRNETLNSEMGQEWAFPKSRILAESWRTQFRPDFGQDSGVTLARIGPGIVTGTVSDMRQ